jgi:glycosyltransferase involved in cell wall biosynthesis
VIRVEADFPKADFATCCVLSYNRPAFLGEMLHTLVGNADYPMEVIVHDDGSSDPHVQAFLRHAMDTGMVSTVILNHPGHNQGQGIALNRMFQMAKGDPILKLDHDLLFKPGWLRQLVSTLETNAKDYSQPRIGALGLHKYEADPVDHRKMRIQGYPGWERCEDFVGSAFAVPRYVWEATGPFEERSEAFAEDYDWKMKIKEQPFGFALGLVAQDVAVNQGFGLGPSTVAVERDGQLTSELIHKRPFLVQ